MESRVAYKFESKTQTKEALPCSCVRSVSPSWFEIARAFGQVTKACFLLGLIQILL